MEKAWKRYIRLMAAATAAMGLLLLYQLADIYINRTTEPMYTYENAVLRLQTLRIPAVLYILLCAAGIIWRSVQSPKTGGEGCDLYCAPREKKPSARLQVLLYVLAGGLLTWGIVNGGLWDVLVKAINICTECIGLG